MMHDEIVTYEVAKLAKEKAFDEECRDFYCNDKRQKRITRTSCNRQVTSFDYCSNSTLEDYDSPKEYFHIAAPTQGLLQRWLREEKGIIILINIGYCYENEEIPFYRNPNMKPLFNGYYYGIWRFSELNDELGRSKYFPTYELALEDALKYALENLV